MRNKHMTHKRAVLFMFPGYKNRDIAITRRIALLIGGKNQND